MSNPGPAVTATSNLVKESVPADGHTFGNAATDLISFYGVTPVAQRAGIAGVAVATTTATTTTPAGFTTLTQANAIVTLVNEIRATLVANGLMKGAA